MTTKLRQSARGQACRVRIPGVCNHDPETSVLAHINGAGMGIKADDRHAAIACSDCHDVIDGRVQVPGMGVDEIRLAHLEGVIRTQIWWIKEGLM